jgi:hypothetical protein
MALHDPEDRLIRAAAVPRPANPELNGDGPHVDRN